MPQDQDDKFAKGDKVDAFGRAAGEGIGVRQFPPDIAAKLLELTRRRSDLHMQLNEREARDSPHEIRAEIDRLNNLKPSLDLKPKKGASRWGLFPKDVIPKPKPAEIERKAVANIAARYQAERDRIDQMIDEERGYVIEFDNGRAEAEAWIKAELERPSADRDPAPGFHDGDRDVDGPDLDTGFHDIPFHDDGRDR